MFVLWVDDEPSVLGYWRAAFEDEGHTLLVATGPDEALEIVSDGDRTIDHVIIDLMLPPGNTFRDCDTQSGSRTGILLAQRIHELLPHVPILLLTNCHPESLQSELPCDFPAVILGKPCTSPSDILDRLVNPQTNTTGAQYVKHGPELSELSEMLSQEKYSSLFSVFMHELSHVMHSAYSAIEHVRLVLERPITEVSHKKACDIVFLAEHRIKSGWERVTDLGRWVSRLESGRGPSRVTKMRVIDAIWSAVKLQGSEWKQVCVEIPRELVISTDSDLCESVLSHLMGFCLYFSESPVRVTAVSVAEGVTIEVEAPIFMTERDMERLWEIGFVPERMVERTRGSITTLYALPAAATYIAILGGDISLRRASEDTTTFVLYIPDIKEPLDDPADR